MITFKTMSGSIYKVAKDKDGQWWLLDSDNKPNSMSSKITKQWKIDAPYIKPGEQAVLKAPAYMAFNDPERIPGGGKITSHVEEILDSNQGLN